LQLIETFAKGVLNDANEYPRVADADEQRLAMRSAARALADLGIDPQRVGAMLERSYRDVRDSGITLDEFESRVRKASLRNRRRTESMIRAWREYERLIAQLGAVDPADVLLHAATLIENGAEDRRGLL
jgi:superfamily I DNA/RNA helicase